MIDIRPDPKRPRGGFAELTISGSTAASDPVEVSVFNSFLEKWLGPDGWQPNIHGFAARQADQDGDTLRLILGPDVVNQIEEDTPIKIGVGGSTWDTYWPDDINHGPDVAIGGDLAGTGAKAMAAAPKPISKITEPEPAPQPEPEPIAPDDLDAGLEDKTDTDVDIDTEIETEKPSKASSMAMWAIALLAVAGMAAWFLLPQIQQESEQETQQAAAPAPEPDTSTGACGAEQLTSLVSDGFAALAEQLRSCGSDINVDLALGFVERAAATNDPDALALFGALYDPNITGEAIKDDVGLSFGDNPARAAEYYARAKDAGSDEGSQRLTATCRTLALKTDTLSQSAHEDFCK